MKLTTFSPERCVFNASQVREINPEIHKQLIEMNKHRKRKHNELLI